MLENVSPSAVMKPRRLRWVLLVAGAICAGAAILVLVIPPPLSARRADSRLEFDVVRTCRAYAEAQWLFSSKDGDRDSSRPYAHPYVELSKIAASGKQATLLDSAFYAAQGPGGVPKGCYLFKDIETICNQPIDWTRDFALCATPARYGKSCRRTFIVSTNGMVWGKDLGKSGFLDNFPADPVEEGWVLAACDEGY